MGRDPEKVVFEAAPPRREEGEDLRTFRRGSSQFFRFSCWIAGIGGSLLTLLLFFRVLENSPLFALERIEIAGTLRASLGELPCQKGPAPGGNLLTLDIEEVTRSLEVQPGIERASVAKRFPNQLVVRVEERQPAALVVVEGDLYHADAGGVIFRRAGSGDTLDLPVISGLSRAVLEFGPRPEGRQMEKALELLANLKRDASILGEVSEVRVDPSEGLTFFLEDLPVPVQIGWEAFEGRKAKIMRIFPLLREKPDGLLSVDLRFDGQIVVRQASACQEQTKVLSRLSAVDPDR